MDRADRYEILQEIASGDFATVSRARDRELAREVAVKQIHAQFLTDPQQLERFWREAQLLASLQHPHILTIYDISRERGWLILELMRGNLAQGVAQGPIDLNYLRQVLTQSLQALQFLHANGIIHGDVKPSNLLLDRQGRIKVGDFGLARRAASDEGSLLKGTTKYMAPELISDEFGSVGPGSDLYSLGFTAYELLCGPQFESLLPGLDAFGRDRQIAWLMWHSAADRRLPEIHRVLDGVPEDLAQIVEKLIQKDCTKRFRSADEVLQILQMPPKTGGPPVPTAEERAEAEAEARKSRQRRIIAVCSFAASLVLSIAMLFSGNNGVKPVQQTNTIEGTVQRIDRSGRKMWVWPSDGGQQKQIELQKSDQVTISGEPSSPGDLQQGDRIIVNSTVKEAGRTKVNRISAFRPVAKQGRVAKIDREHRMLVFQSDEDVATIDVFVPESLDILFNNHETFEGKPITLTNVAPNDRINIRCVDMGDGWEATELSVERIVAAAGVVAKINVTEKELVVTTEGANGQLHLSFDNECRVTINDLVSLHEKPFSVTDLRPGDEVKLEHDSRLVRIDAVRTTKESGTIEGVVEQARVVSIRRENAAKVTPFLIDSSTVLSLNGVETPMRRLRQGDRVRVTHQSLDLDRPTAREVAAYRPADKRRWAIVVGVGTYRVATLSPLKHAIADAQALATTMTTHFQVPENHLRALIDPTTIQLKHGVAQLLSEPGPEPGDSVSLYFAGHGYVDDGGAVHLATSDFDPAEPDANDTTLQWLVDQLEACPATDKLVLLDCCQAAWPGDPKRQPSTSEMLEMLKGPPGQAALRTVTAIASASPGQRGQADPSGSRGLFGYYINEAFSGDADINRDKQLEVSELNAYLRARMQSAEAKLDFPQAPTLVLPNAAAPRLSREAKEAVVALAALLSSREPESTEIFARYSTATDSCGKEIEPELIYGLLLMKTRDREGAARQFQEVLLAHPENLVALQARAWLWCLAIYHVSGPRPDLSLDVLVRRIHEPDCDISQDRKAAILRWAGQIRQYVDTIADSKPAGTKLQLQRLDAAVEGEGDGAKTSYNEGRQQVTALLTDFDKKLAETDAPASSSQIRLQRSSLKNYVAFPYNLATEIVVEGMDH